MSVSKLHGGGKTFCMSVTVSRLTVLLLIYFVRRQECLQTESRNRGHQLVIDAGAQKGSQNCSSGLGRDCGEVLEHGVCDTRSGHCVCGDTRPIRIRDTCVGGAKLRTACVYTEQCQHYDTHAVCSESGPVAGVSVCVCSEGWSLAQEHGPGVHSATGRVRHVCELARTESHVEDVATLAGLGIGLSVLALFICFTLRLFSKARNVEARGFGDASLPPTIMVEGREMDQEAETVSRTSSKSRIYTPGPPLTPSQVRRMSELSSLSVTVAERDFKMRPVSPGQTPGCHNGGSASGPGSLDMLFEEGKDEGVEQQLTIIPKLGSLARRKSLVNHAFPELHRKSSAASNSLVILTRTKTDSQGRRHSVAVPLLAAPHSSRQDTGYVIERTAPRDGSRDRLVAGGGPLAQRRHSLQVGGGGGARLPGSRSPRRQSSVRRQQARRPSKQGFYQFLEQAVAF